MNYYFTESYKCRESVLHIRITRYKVFCFLSCFLFIFKKRKCFTIYGLSENSDHTLTKRINNEEKYSLN